MLFKDILDAKGSTLSDEIERLFHLALRNQNHSGNLLLVLANGFYQKDIGGFITSDGKRLSPYVIGPGAEGHSAQTHYKFINQYRTTYIHPLDHKEYVKLFDYNPGKREEIEKLLEKEETTIQLEMLIYLKIWEADLTIKKLYQFTQILHKEDYNWHFKVSESSRDTDSIGTRQEVIRTLIREKIKSISPILYDAIKAAYKTQIRNSIAHSNYSFQGRNIHLNNYVESDKASQLHNVEFDEWIDIFHTTLLIHNLIIGLDNRIRSHYAELASKGQTLEVKIIEPSVRKFSRVVEYREDWQDFIADS
ncbi:hypothetical protein [Hymenobacter elongatus]|uniref:Uncharacterized protein n=1 Tax=Hymenobacter elongatus TaxID=877208 RepID=A0A4Z0PE95_9BACT|nr:hypothetical protein [Hymenobacter elongatus]TGE12228.1 hypothetical protein E5J99_20440 [Hymenobacter elongatus]